MAYRFHSDPGHGWLEVPRSLLNELGIENAISPYSYVRGGAAFLEEDCDAGLFRAAYEAVNGKLDYVVVHHDHDAPCRSYSRYPLDPAWQVHAAAARSAAERPRPRSMPIEQAPLL